MEVQHGLHYGRNLIRLRITRSSLLAITNGMSPWLPGLPLSQEQTPNSLGG